MNLQEFQTKMIALNKDVPKTLSRIIYVLGEELLNAVTDEIIRQDLIQNGAAGLLGSFAQGNENNVWEFDADLQYAFFGSRF